MGKRIKVPRASIAVTTLDDPDILALTETIEGVAAWGVFTLMLVAAKNQDNGGTFQTNARGIARLLRIDESIVSNAVSKLSNPVTEGSKPWLLTSERGIAIRTFAKWNKGWGGPRNGAGKKSSGNQDVIKCPNLNNQDDFKKGVAVPVPVPVPDTVLFSESKDSQRAKRADALERKSKPKSKPDYSESFETWWATFPHRQGDPKKPAWESYRKLDDDDRQAAYDGAVRMEREWRGVADRKFVPQAVTWLNQRRWESEPSKPDVVKPPVDNFEVTEDYSDLGVPESMRKAKQ
jgi:hypothetical protein